MVLEIMEKQMRKLFSIFKTSSNNKTVLPITDRQKANLSNQIYSHGERFDEKYYQQILKDLTGPWGRKQ